MKVGVVNKSQYPIPIYGKIGNSGMDVKANITESITLKPLERVLIPTGLFFDIPEGYEIQVRPRSGLALKRGLTVLNTPGTVDSFSGSH
jgi:dUTP pyrophosphatase